MLLLISRNEDKLLATMTDAQKELFIRYAECMLFQNSFRLGAKNDAGGYERVFRYLNKIYVRTVLGS